MIEQLTPLYVLEWDGGADYVCRGCADEFVKDNGLEWDNPNSLNYTLENDKGLSAWVDHFHQIESDSPQACECGQYLEVRLTPDGENYLRDNDFPEFLLKHYGIETYLQERDNEWTTRN